GHQGVLQHRAQYQGEVLARRFRARIFAMDHLALFGDLDFWIQGARRLGADRLVRWSTAPTHGPTATVENAQGPPMPGHDRRDRFMRAVERPRGAEIANLLVAIGISEHDLLDPGATVELTPIDRVGQESVHGGRRSLQCIEPLEQWHDVEVTARWIAAELVKTGQPCRSEERRVGKAWRP